MPFTPTVITRSMDRRNGKPNVKDNTAPQVLTSRGYLSTPELPKSNFTAGENWESIVTQIRIHPTVAFVRELATAPIVAAEWGVQELPGAPAGSGDYIAENLLEIRDYFVRSTNEALLDYGWLCWESIYRLSEDRESVLIDKIKPLIQLYTTILVDPRHGEYLGVKQDIFGAEQITKIVRIGNYTVSGSSFLDRRGSVLCNINVEGTDWYGRPILRNIYDSWLGWQAVNEAADQYDRKVAGTKWVIYYPYGTNDYNGQELDNQEIAKILVGELENSVAIAVPRHVDETIQEFEAGKGPADAWRIELMSDSTNQQENFIDRLKYYDNLMARGLFFPERSILEGKFGTKAEADSHADFAITVLESRHKLITDFAQRQIVNKLLMWTYGRDAVNKVKLKAAPIADNTRQFFRTVYTEMLKKDLVEALKDVDLNQMQDELGMPLVKHAQRVVDEERIDSMMKANDNVNNQGPAPGTADNNTDDPGEEGKDNVE